MAEKPIDNSKVARAVREIAAAEEAADHQKFSDAVQQRAFGGKGSVFRKVPDNGEWANRAKEQEASDQEQKGR